MRQQDQAQRDAPPLLTALGRLRLRGAHLARISDLLSIGSVVHVGRRTASGQGQYRIEGWN
jgi:hypothetical protein